MNRRMRNAECGTTGAGYRVPAAASLCLLASAICILAADGPVNPADPAYLRRQYAWFQAQDPARRRPGDPARPGTPPPAVRRVPAPGPGPPAAASKAPQRLPAAPPGGPGPAHQGHAGLQRLAGEAAGGRPPAGADRPVPGGTA